MNERDDSRRMAVFCDFENVALGVRDANYEKFDVAAVLERLLLRGSIVVRKAYCDWERYKAYKKTMHEASFELIEIPHVRVSGKNSADIRMVVDALDLCYTKPFVDTFVVVSGDSDFSPLVSKLRENNRIVVGVGVRQSTSDLLTAICDEFIYYDDLVRKRRPAPKRRRGKGKTSETGAGAAAPADSTQESAQEIAAADESAQQALDWVLEIVTDLFEERDEEEKVWGSMVKQTLKRRRPGFSERAHGFRNFGELLEEAQRRGLLSLAPDDKSGGYIVTSYEES